MWRVKSFEYQEFFEKTSSFSKKSTLKTPTITFQVHKLCMALNTVHTRAGGGAEVEDGSAGEKTRTPGAITIARLKNIKCTGGC